MPDTNEEQYAAQLAESKARDREKPEKAETKALGALGKLLKNPIIKLLIPTVAEIGSGGLLPGNLGLVIWTYLDEKKAGQSPNIAEYLIVGIPAAAVDGINLLGLSGVLLIFSWSISVPCLGLLWFWKLYKGIKPSEPT